MKARRIVALFILTAASTAAYRVGYDDETVYSSLDTLAEIMTLAQSRGASEADSKELVEGAIDGLLQQLDPHTNYYNRDRYLTMKEDQHGTFFGIGIIVGFQNGKLTVISPLAGAPAARAGMQAGDVIAEIDEVYTEAMPTHEAIRLLRGTEGSEVRLKLLRTGLEEPLFVTLKRSEIPSWNVRASFMADEHTGYVALKEFGETASAEVKKALERLKQEGMTQVILDLRGNPGGLLPQAIELSSLFMGADKLVVSTKGRMKTSNKNYYTRKRKPFEDLPLIVLIDRGSASASEIVAGALQDHDRGLILGVSSWGKGLVQSVFPLSTGDTGLALTTSRYYTPSGRNIQGNYESLEDYYNPKSAKDTFFAVTEEAGKPDFQTAHGRPVLQVRGITPDVFISFDQEDELLSTLNSQNVFFNFATREQAKMEPITADFEADDGMLAAFKSWLVAEEIDVEGFEAHRQAIREKLTYQFLYISPNEESESWSWRYRMKHDRHVKAALELFPRAGELLAVYDGTSDLPPGYTAQLRAFARARDETRQNAALKPVEPGSEKN